MNKDISHSFYSAMESELEKDAFSIVPMASKTLRSAVGAFRKAPVKGSLSKRIVGHEFMGTPGGPFRYTPDPSTRIKSLFGPTTGSQTVATPMVRSSAAPLAVKNQPIDQGASERIQNLFRPSSKVVAAKPDNTLSVAAKAELSPKKPRGARALVGKQATTPSTTVRTRAPKSKAPPKTRVSKTTEVSPRLFEESSFSGAFNSTPQVSRAAAAAPVAATAPAAAAVSPQLSNPILSKRIGGLSERSSALFGVDPSTMTRDQFKNFAKDTQKFSKELSSTIRSGEKEFGLNQPGFFRKTMKTAVGTAKGVAGAGLIGGGALAYGAFNRPPTSDLNTLSGY